MTPPNGAPEYDLIVVGAGINGAGIARDAAMRGLRVLLLDKGDVASGTTSWSTRLIHGGLRYLEHGEIGLVRESLRERERLLHAAPHLVKPLPLLIPLYRGDRRGRWLVRAGMLAYDALSFDKSLAPHRMLGREAALHLVPDLRPDGLLGAAMYFDAQAEYAERLAVENVLSARAHGADVRTYARVERIVDAGGRVAGVEGTDLLDDAGAAFAARAPVVVNVGGPWVDAVLASDPLASGRRLVGGTKGSHVVVSPFPGAPREALYAEARGDGRPYFVIPWNDLYLIGTTDVRYDGDLDRVVAGDDEIDYLLAETNRILPSAALTRGDVLYTYAGVRPLPFRPQGEEGKITRRHQIVRHDRFGGPRGLISIVGGKLTTYRALAAQVVDAVYALLDRPAPPSPTDGTLLPGAVVPGGDLAAFAARFVDESGLPERSARHLIRVYGGRATEVLARATEPDLRQPFDPDSGAIGAEILFAIRNELARTLADVLLRRTMAGYGPAVGVGADEAAAAVARRHLGWDDARTDREVAAYREYIARYRPRSLALAPAVA